MKIIGKIFFSVIGAVLGSVLAHQLMARPQYSWTLPVVQIPDPVYTDILTIRLPDDVLLVSIDAKGGITYGPNYKPDEAAKKFWEAMGRWAPCPKPQLEDVSKVKETQ